MNIYRKEGELAIIIKEGAENNQKWLLSLYTNAANVEYKEETYSFFGMESAVLQEEISGEIDELFDAADLFFETDGKRWR